MTEISYYMFGPGGVKIPGLYTYGDLIKAIQEAIESNAVVYRHDGVLVYEDDMTNYSFVRPKKISFKQKRGKGVDFKRIRDLYCICDQCQEAWK